MDRSSTIKEAVDRIVKAASPLRVILFGSAARETASPDSDLDFLVVESVVNSKIKEMVRLRRVLGGLSVPIDILVTSQEELSEWGGVPGCVYYWALKEGIVLYEAPK